MNWGEPVPLKCRHRNVPLPDPTMCEYSWVRRGGFSTLKHVLNSRAAMEDDIWGREKPEKILSFLPMPYCLTWKCYRLISIQTWFTVCTRDLSRALRFATTAGAFSHELEEETEDSRSSLRDFSTLRRVEVRVSGNFNWFFNICIAWINVCFFLIGAYSEPK